MNFGGSFLLNICIWPAYHRRFRNLRPTAWLPSVWGIIASDLTHSDATPNCSAPAGRDCARSSPVHCGRTAAEVRLADVLPACGAARGQLEVIRNQLRQSAVRLAGLVRSTAISLSDWQGLIRGLLGEGPHEGRYDMNGQRTGGVVPVRIEARF